MKAKEVFQVSCAFRANVKWNSPNQGQDPEKELKDLTRKWTHQPQN